MLIFVVRVVEMGNLELAIVMGTNDALTSYNEISRFHFLLEGSFIIMFTFCELPPCGCLALLVLFAMLITTSCPTTLICHFRNFPKGKRKTWALSVNDGALP